MKFYVTVAMVCITFLIAMISRDQALSECSRNELEQVRATCKVRKRIAIIEAENHLNVIEAMRGASEELENELEARVRRERGI